MTKAERDEIRKRRCAAPENEVDLQLALEATLRALLAHFSPVGLLSPAVWRFREAAITALLAAVPLVENANADLYVERLRSLIPPGMRLEGIPEPGPAPNAWIPLLQAALPGFAAGLSDSDWTFVAHAALVGAALNEKPYKGDFERKAPERVREFRSALRALRHAIDEVDERARNFKAATLTTTTVPSRGTQGKPRIRNWTAAVLVDCLLRSDPPWNDKELSLLFDRFKVPELASRDAVHSLKRQFRLPRPGGPMATARPRG